MFIRSCGIWKAFEKINIRVNVELKIKRKGIK